MRWRRARRPPIDALRRLDDLTDSKRRKPRRSPASPNAPQDDVVGGAELTWAPAAPLPRWPMLVSTLFLLALVLLQDPGKVSFETKFDLVLDPSAFLGRALHLWDATGGFGQVQNQAVGYVFPMGPFAILTHALGLPDWIGQRLWMALLLISPMWGMAKLASALRIGGPSGWVIGGLAYALAPFFVGLLGFTSAAVLPAAVMPWTVLPLVRASQTGSVRRAAGLSGLAILCMGGINATSAITVLFVPAIYIVTRGPGRRRRALMFWWPLAVFLASFWWLAALFFQARYGLDVTAFTETADVTESTTAAAEVMRGTGNWLGYLNLGDPWVRASWALVSAPVAIIGTAVVAATGMLGLAARGMRERWFAVGTFVFGVVAIGVGYTGAASGFFGEQFVDLLGGPLAPFRNIYKFEPLVAASLALGVAHAVPAASGWVARRGLVRRKVSAPRPAGPGPWRIVQYAVPAVVLAGIVASALPFLQGRGNTDGAFDETPAYWSEASTWLGQRAPDDTTLLLPAAAFAEYDWGRPLDEPMQALQKSPWIARTLQPLGGAGSTRVLDAIESRIVTQRDSPGLRDLLRRSGVRYLLVRNDLDWRRTASPRPYKVRQALLKARIPRVQGFGPRLAELGVSSALMADLGVSRDESAMQAVEIYDVNQVASASKEGKAAYDDDAVRGPDAVESGAAGEAVSPVSTFAVGGEQVVSGGPESTVQGADWGLTRTRANILAADLPAADPATDPATTTTKTPRETPPATARWIVSDAYRHARADFGLVHDSSSYTLRRDELAPGQTITPQLIPETLRGFDAVATLPPPSMPGALDQPASVTASTYGSWLLQLPELQPAHVFDHDPSTVWVAGDARSSRGQWAQMTFTEPRYLERLRVRLLRDGPFRPRVTKLRITTDQGTRVTELADTESRQEVLAVFGRTSFVRVTLEGVAGDRGGEVGAGLRSVDVPGIAATAYVKPPQEPALLDWAKSTGRNPTFLFSRLTVDPDDLLRRDEEPEIRRQFTVPVTGDMEIAGRAVPARSKTLDTLLTRTRGIHVRATSTYNAHPRYRASGAFDGTIETEWIAAPPAPLSMNTPSAPGLTSTATGFKASKASPVPLVLDTAPALRITFHRRQTLDRIRVREAREFASAPSRLRLTTAEGDVRIVDVGGNRMVSFPEVTTKGPLTIEFIGVRRNYALSEGGVRTPLAVGVADIDFPALRDQRVIPLPPKLKIATKCGEGPDVIVDGRRLRTRLETTAGDATLLKTAPFKLCGLGEPLELSAGEHQLVSGDDGRWIANDIKVVPTKRPALAPLTARTATVDRWEATSRQIAMTAGPATYLQLHQNVSDGWDATLDGAPLRPVTLDGWQQGFIVPAGAAGVIDLQFTPDRSFRKLLLIGALLALLLLPFALLRSWTGWLVRESPGGIEPVGSGGAGAAGEGGPASAAARTNGPTVRRNSSGWLEVGGSDSFVQRWVDGLARRRARASAAPAVGTWRETSGTLIRIVWFVGAVVGVAALSVPAVVAVPLLVLLRWRWPRVLPVVAAGALLSTAVITAIAQEPFAGDSGGAFSPEAQVIAAIAFGAVLVTRIPSRRRKTAPPIGASAGTSTAAAQRKA